MVIMNDGGVSQRDVTVCSVPKHGRAINHERLIFSFGEALNISKDMRGETARNPFVGGHALASIKVHEVVRTLGVAGGIEGNGINGARLHGIGRIVVDMNLNIRTKSDFEVVKIKRRTTGDDGGRTEGIRNTVTERESV